MTSSHPIILSKKPPLVIRLSVLSAVDYAPGRSIRARIKHIATPHLYRYKTRADKNLYRKIQLNELAEAIHNVLPTLSYNKTGLIPKQAIYRKLLKHDYFQRSQLTQTSFYRMVRQNNLLDTAQTQKLRLSFAMQFAYRDVMYSGFAGAKTSF